MKQEVTLPESIRGIVVFRPGAIGDTLLSFPALSALRQRFPAARVRVIGNRPALALGQAAGLFDASDAFGADWVADLFGDRPTDTLRARLADSDLGVIWMHDRVAAIELARAVRSAGVGTVLPLVSFPETGCRQHLADFLLDSLAPLGIVPPAPSVVLSPSTGETSPPRTVVLHPGAGAQRKRWPAERFASLADRFVDRGWSVALTSGPADEAAVGAVRDQIHRASPRVLAGLNLSQLADVLARAQLFVGNDSGITHLAAMLGVPTVALFGPFDPVYWAPRGPRVSVIDAGTECAHRADPREGCRGCERLLALAVETVWEAANALLESIAIDQR
ncbi:MAG TPA: glycosyltransferase family 9 protein [Chloroflexota bacterium]|nr:glycosyltransferase family 9 protein [Chloroflexota bacterium]